MANAGRWLLLLVAAAILAGCDQPAGGYLSVSEITRNGFLGEHGELPPASGMAIRLWGFVDAGNVYGDADAQRILGEWWSGAEADADTWRFNLKGAADDPVGHSFLVYIPNDSGRDEILRRWVADARAGKPTPVFVKGRLFTFPAPTQIRTLTGVYLRLRSSRDIRFEP